MRRHAESLTILSGAAPGRSWTEPVPVIDVIRGAMAEVEDYKRVSVLTAAEDAVAGPAVADMIHLLAELIENATLFSPSGTRVEVRAERVANGFAIEIDDRGLGIEPGQLREINQQLARPPDFDLANADRLGLFVGAKLAARHGVRVSLRPSPYGGTTAIVLMPNSIVVPVSEPMRTPTPAPPGDRPDAGLDLDHADALALTGRHPAPPSLPESTSRSTGPPTAASARPGTPPPPVTPTTASARARRLPAGQPGPAGTNPGTRAGPCRPGTRARPPAARTAGLAAGQPTPGTGRPRRGPPRGRAPGHRLSPHLAGARRPASRDRRAARPGPAPGRSRGTYRGLPRRIRQASLFPHLRDSLGRRPAMPPASREPGPDPGAGPQPRRVPADRVAARPPERCAGGGARRTAHGAGRQDSAAPRGEET